MTKKVEWHGTIPNEAQSWLTFSNQSDKGYEYNKYFTEITASTDDNGGSITDEIKFNVAKNNTLLNRSATVFFKQRGGKTATYKVMQKAPHELTPTGNESAYTYVETVNITPDDQSCKYNETQYQFKASYTAIPKIATEYFWPDEGMSSAFYDTEHLTDGIPINDTDVSNFDWEKVSDGDDWTIKDGKITFPVNKDKDKTRTFKVRGTYKNHISNSSGNYSDEGSIIQEKNGDVYHYKIDISPSNSYTWKWDEVDERSFTVESYYTLNDETTKHNVDFQVDSDTSNDFDWKKDGNVIYVKPTGTNDDSANKKNISFNVRNNGATAIISLTQYITKYDYVDLGLPSGTLWATCNVGASKPSDAGQYFQWGDTSGYTADQIGTGEGQKKFASNWSDYKWYLSGNEDDNSIKFKKYTTAGATLELEDDAAHANMGGTWHMPTPTQINELINNTTTAWTTSDGVSGMTFTSKKDTSKAIFIPAAGSAWDGSVRISGDFGSVWSYMMSRSGVGSGQGLHFYSDRADLGSTDCYCGNPVRGVIGSNSSSEPNNGHPYVDLGLPNGTLWATCNVGADKPTDFGLYFQWGDVQGYTKEQVGTGEGQKKFASNYSDYKWRLSGDSYDNVAFTKYTTPDAKLELEDDAAHVHMGGDWHMPTDNQIQELIDNTTTAWTTSDGVRGIMVTSKKDKSKSIFIPATGVAWEGLTDYNRNDTFVWSSMLNRNVYNAKCIMFDLSSVHLTDDGRCNGHSVRGVID